jgi:hypothetical protein
VPYILVGKENQFFDRMPHFDPLQDCVCFFF